MITKILYIILVAIPFIVSLCLYKSRKNFMARFCLRMTALAAARKLFRLVLLIVLLTFHCLYLCVQFKEIGVIGSTLALAIFFSTMKTEKWLHRLHENRLTFCTAAIAVLVCLAVPHLFTLAVSVGFVLLAAQFYPSQAVLSLWENKDDRNVLIADKEILIEYYY